jgi:hypothetical protein
VQDKHTAGTANRTRSAREKASERWPRALDEWPRARASPSCHFFSPSRKRTSLSAAAAPRRHATSAVGVLLMTRAAPARSRNRPAGHCIFAALV